MNASSRALAEIRRRSSSDDGVGSVEFSAFVSRAASTLTLVALRELAARASEGWLGLLGPRTPGLAQAGSLRLVARELAACSGAPSRDVCGLWSGAFVAFAGAGAAPLRAPTLPPAAVAAGFAPDLRWRARLLDRACSISDQLDILVLEARERRDGAGPGRSFSLATSHSQRFLVELVARNRGDSVGSVMREAVALLCDESA